MIIQRWKLFFYCLCVNLIISALITIKSIQVWSLNTPFAISIFLQTNSGAFAGIWVLNIGINSPSVWCIGIPNLILMFLHPIKPNEKTGAITILGFVIWLIMGLSFAYIDV